MRVAGRGSRCTTLSQTAHIIGLLLVGFLRELLLLLLLLLLLPLLLLLLRLLLLLLLLT